MSTKDSKTEQTCTLHSVTRRKIQKLNEKNENKKEYSLGDVMLLDKWEKQLYAHGYTQNEIEAMSPSFYGR